MLILRFRITFRERMPEWLLAAGLAVWGLIVAHSPGLFGREFFQPLARIAHQQLWGWGALTVGLARLLFLGINGSWRPSADLRAVGCWLSIMVWTGLLIGAVSVDWRSPAVATYGMLLILDSLSMFYAVADASRYSKGRAYNGVR